MDRSIPYGRQEITSEDIEEVVKVLQSDFLTQGPKVEEFEKGFANYVGSEYAIAVTNGTAALHLGALALGLKKGDNVITTPISFVATSNCIRYCRGNVYFADINPETLLLDINAVESLIKSKPEGFFSGIIPVTLGGMPVDLESYRTLADQHGLWLIEDACHSPGASFLDSKGNEQKSGNGKYADLSIFSFHPVKHIACGEGGMVTTNNPEIDKKIRLLRSHGVTKEDLVAGDNQGGWYYEMQELGYNYRIADISCALGISQLTRANENLRKRREIAAYYDLELSELPIKKYSAFPGRNHAFHLYIIHTERRKELYDYLRDKGVYTQVHYIPIHTQPYYRNGEIDQPNLDNAEEYYSGALSLPMYPSISQSDLEYVVKCIKSFFS